MGSSMKKSIFDEHTSEALKKWHKAVKKKQETVRLGKSSARTSTIGSTVNSPGPTLHRFKTTGHSTRTATYEDEGEYESDDIELSPLSPATNLLVKVDHGDHQQEAEEHRHISSEGETNHEDDFTFFKPDPMERTTM
ncbi:Mlo-related protein [Sesbania bispinosa]|nr:Mlo-related protein [Sesbania bispinosa]